MRYSSNWRYFRTQALFSKTHTHTQVELSSSRKCADKTQTIARKRWHGARKRKRWSVTSTCGRLKNPFNARDNAKNFLAVYVDGRQVPAKPFQSNFETSNYIRSYVNLFSATGKQSQDKGNEFSRDDFGQGYTFFGFDLTPTVATVVVSIWKERVISASRCTLQLHWNRPPKRSRIRWIRCRARDRQRSQHHLQLLVETDQIITTFGTVPVDVSLRSGR